jgi:hypothetical protein
MFAKKRKYRVATDDGSHRYIAEHDGKAILTDSSEGRNSGKVFDYDDALAIIEAHNASAVIETYEGGLKIEPASGHILTMSFGRRAYTGDSSMPGGLWSPNLGDAQVLGLFEAKSTRRTLAREESEESGNPFDVCRDDMHIDFLL